MSRRRRVAVQGMAVLMLSLAAFGASPALAEPLAPEQDPTKNPAIAVMPADAATTGPFIGTTSENGSTLVSRKGYADLRTFDIGIKSTAMGGITLPVRVVVPPGWTPTNGDKLPIAFFLQGGNDNYTSWYRETNVEDLAAKYKVLLVFPEAGRAAHYTNYFNAKGPAGPLQWETFHTKEIPQILAKAFNADTSRMGIMGASSGGYGASAYPARNPGMFKFAGVMSGPLDIQDFTVTMLILTTAAANTQGFDRFGSPWENKDNWTAHNPYALVENLRGTSLFISSGLTGQDAPEDIAAQNPWTPLQVSEYFNGQVATRFVAKLKEKNIPVTARLYEKGQHNWPSWRRELVTAFAQEMKALSAVPVGSPGSVAAPNSVTPTPTPTSSAPASGATVARRIGKTGTSSVTSVGNPLEYLSRVLGG